MNHHEPGVGNLSSGKPCRHNRRWNTWWWYSGPLTPLSYSWTWSKWWWRWCSVRWRQWCGGLSSESSSHSILNVESRDDSGHKIIVVSWELRSWWAESSPGENNKKLKQESATIVLQQFSNKPWPCCWTLESDLILSSLSDFIVERVEIASADWALFFFRQDHNRSKIKWPTDDHPFLL